MMYTKHKWNSDVHYNFSYVKYLPKDFDENKKYPLVFFLHGAGERGDDLDLAVKHGYMKYVREEGREYPFIFIAPQCPKKKYWGCFTESLLAFLDDICETLPIDRDRVYLTGLSMGGTGSWMLAMADPDRFAALAPICGTGIYWNTECLKNLPIYVYHGDADSLVPISESINMISSVNKKGGHAQIKILYGVAHSAWEQAYSDDSFWIGCCSKNESCLKLRDAFGCVDVHVIFPCGFNLINLERIFKNEKKERDTDYDTFGVCHDDVLLCGTA